MVSHLKISIVGVFYQSERDSIELAATEGEAGIEKVLTANQDKTSQYHQNGEFIGECEDGEVIWELDDRLHSMCEQLEDARFELRKAFIISTFHYWEKSVQKWLSNSEDSKIKKNRQGFDKLAKEFRRLHIHYNEMPREVHPALKSINYLVNVLKHSGTKSWKKLKEQCPPELSSLISSNDTSEGFSDLLKPSAEQLQWIFKVIRESGLMTGLSER